MRVLLVDAEAERAAAVQAGLQAAGYAVVALSADTRDLTRQVRDSDAEVIVCDIDDPSRDALESMRALHRDEPRPVVVFAARGDPGQIADALAAGVAAYVVEGLSPERVSPVLQVAILRFRAFQALQQELREARETLARRDLIDAAKRRLMRDEGLTEPEAHRHLQRIAMRTGDKLADVSAEILRRL